MCFTLCDDCIIIFSRFQFQIKQYFCSSINRFLCLIFYPLAHMATSDNNPLIQYILLRRDMKKMKNYNDGAIIAQACHASTAILFKTMNDELTKLYFNDLDRMHKIILGVEGGEKELNELSDLLKENSIEHYRWIEQPENIPTAIAVKPYFKKDVEHFFAKFKLYR